MDIFKLTRHCQVCEYQKIGFDIGSICTLTEQKPDFEKVCPNILFGDKLEQTIVEANTAFEKAKKGKTEAYLSFGFMLFLAVTIWVGAYLFSTYIISKGVIGAVPFIIGAIGFYVFQLAFGAFNKWRSDMSIAVEKKNHLDAILALYKKGYDIDIVFGRKYHGHQDTTVNLKMKRI